MSPQPALSPTLAIDWCVAARPLPGQSVSGDIHEVVFLANGAAVAVADGLGHGEEAALAAATAAATVRKFADMAPVDIVRHCHEALRRTRGVALSLATFNAGNDTMTWIGVGNVEGKLVRAASAGTPARESLLLRGGVVGYALPSLRATTLPVAPGDILILATDGIRTAFINEAVGEAPLQDLADDIMARHSREIDDALVLVVRYLGVRS